MFHCVSLHCAQASTTSRSGHATLVPLKRDQAVKKLGTESKVGSYVVSSEAGPSESKVPRAFSAPGDPGANAYLLGQDEEITFTFFTLMVFEPPAAAPAAPELGAPAPPA